MPNVEQVAVTEACTHREPAVFRFTPGAWRATPGFDSPLTVQLSIAYR